MPESNKDLLLCLIFFKSQTMIVYKITQIKYFVVGGEGGQDAYNRGRVGENFQ